MESVRSYKSVTPDSGDIDGLVVRDARPDDIRPMMAVYSACISDDPGYLPFLAPDDESGILDWFQLKPLLACLVAEQDGEIAGVAGLRNAEPGPGDGEPGGRWLEACRLAVHPAHRGGTATRELIGARMSRAAALGADRLWMRCVENSASHRLAVAHGWTWWARTEFDGPAAVQSAILLAHPIASRADRLPGMPARRPLSAPKEEGTAGRPPGGLLWTRRPGARRMMRSSARTRSREACGRAG